MAVGIIIEASKWSLSFSDINDKHQIYLFLENSCCFSNTALDVHLCISILTDYFTPISTSSSCCDSLYIYEVDTWPLISWQTWGQFWLLLHLSQSSLIVISAQLLQVGQYYLQIMVPKLFQCHHINHMARNRTLAWLTKFSWDPSCCFCSGYNFYRDGLLAQHSTILLSHSGLGPAMVEV